MVLDLTIGARFTWLRFEVAAQAGTVAAPATQGVVQSLLPRPSSMFDFSVADAPKQPATHSAERQPQQRDWEKIRI